MMPWGESRTWCPALRDKDQDERIVDLCGRTADKISCFAKRKANEDDGTLIRKPLDGDLPEWTIRPVTGPNAVSIDTFRHDDTQPVSKCLPRA